MGFSAEDRTPHVQGFPAGAAGSEDEVDGHKIKGRRVSRHCTGQRQEMLTELPT